MADKKITELPAYSVLSAADVLPVVDISADTTVKVPVNSIIPDGGDEADMLVKSSGTDFDSEWVVPFSARVAAIEWRGAAGVDGPTLNASGLNDVLYGTENYNNIAGFGIKSGVPGTLEFPVGVFLLNFNICPYNTLRTRLYIRLSGGAIVLTGATSYNSAGTGPPSILTGVLTVASADDYEVLVSVEHSERAGLHDLFTHVSYESYGQGTIQQIG